MTSLCSMGGVGFCFGRSVWWCEGGNCNEVAWLGWVGVVVVVGGGV